MTLCSNVHFKSHDELDDKRKRNKQRSQTTEIVKETWSADECRQNNGFKKIKNGNNLCVDKKMIKNNN